MSITNTPTRAVAVWTVAVLAFVLVAQGQESPEAGARHIDVSNYASMS